MNKDDVIAVLREMADLLEITDANSFEVMAYRNGAQGLADWSGNLNQAVADSRLTEIPAVGKGLSQVVSDLVQVDSSDELDRVRALVPRELPTLLRIRGLGPKRVRALWRELGIESPADLRRAAEEGRLSSLRGFGAKTVERIVSGLDYLQQAPTRKATAPTSSSGPMPAAPRATGRIWAGTSGYSYPDWKGGFYPEDARTDELLKLYAERLASVEVNNTFYRFPSEKVIAQWIAQTPEDFQFAVKAHRRITHQLRLSPQAHDGIVEFVERCGQLGGRLGCILFQLPPNLPRDDARLETLLKSLPPGPRYAVEFRHASWFEDDISQRLRERNVACVSGDAEGEVARRVVTADFVYTRLRRGLYSESELNAWDTWFRAQQQEQRDVFMYLKHDDAGLVPNAVITRWGQAKSTARRILTEKLAKPAKRTAKRRRKTG